MYLHKTTFECHPLVLRLNWDTTVNIVEAAICNKVDMQFLKRDDTSRMPVFLIRLMVGAVFLSEGIQKFLFPEQLGVGRFLKIGLPSAEWLAPMVGAFEVACGSLLLLGLWTRWAVIPLLGVILTAIVTTKLPILMHQGFWKMAHEARTDYAMLMGLLFLLWVSRQPLEMNDKQGDHDQD